ncbi:hypothetical protein HMN09_00845700 [Mycena chlorophos]|uniref:Uncharacterized protein n=1 Tax=Mycena chlorophos TaxID=658473 RepID=A0A8H6SV11_MYCCL|nr:hypothetical protein HMN09_00845700 [Mycena chlorophos]
MPFILPNAEVAPVSESSSWEWPSATDWKPLTWLSMVSPVHLLFLSALFLLLAVRSLLRLRRSTAQAEVEVPVVEKAETAAPATTWLTFSFFPLPGFNKTNTNAELPLDAGDLSASDPIEITVEVVALPAPHRPRAHKPQMGQRDRVLKLAVDAPLPGLYVSEPASMAKLIMSRHTYRRPSPPTPRRARSLSPPKRSHSLSSSSVPVPRPISSTPAA